MSMNLGMYRGKKSVELFQTTTAETDEIMGAGNNDAKMEKYLEVLKRRRYDNEQIEEQRKLITCLLKRQFQFGVY